MKLELKCAKKEIEGLKKRLPTAQQIQSDIKENYYHQHEDELKEYHANNIAESTLDDGLADAFDEWWEELPEDEAVEVL